MYIVMLEKGCYLAPWIGDPGRTLDIKAARKYKTIRGANIALGLARKYRPFKNARIIIWCEPSEFISILTFTEESRDKRGGI